MEILRNNQRGHANHGWLNSRHTFSFADYYNPKRMGFGVLRVINDDRVAPGSGFPTHPHRDMEIVSYVVEGGLEHRDTLGTGSVIHPNEVQRMSAGTGVAHSEFNASKQDPVRFLQIWIQPAARGTQPGYEQKGFTQPEDGALQLVVSPDGADGSVRIGQDARIYRFKPGKPVQATHALPKARSAWLQVVRGEVTFSRVQDEGADTDAVTLTEGDAIALPEGGTVALAGQAGAEALLFDVPEVPHV